MWRKWTWFWNYITRNKLRHSKLVTWTVFNTLLIFVHNRLVENNLDSFNLLFLWSYHSQKEKKIWLKTLNTICSFIITLKLNQMVHQRNTKSYLVASVCGIINQTSAACCVRTQTAWYRLSSHIIIYRQS